MATLTLETFRQSIVDDLATPIAMIRNLSQSFASEKRKVESTVIEDEVTIHLSEMPMDRIAEVLSRAAENRSKEEMNKLKAVSAFIRGGYYKED